MEEEEKWEREQQEQWEGRPGCEAEWEGRRRSGKWDGGRRGIMTVLGKLVCSRPSRGPQAAAAAAEEEEARESGNPRHRREGREEDGSSSGQSSARSLRQAAQRPSLASLRRLTAGRASRPLKRMSSLLKERKSSATGGVGATDVVLAGLVEALRTGGVDELQMDGPTLLARLGDSPEFVRALDTASGVRSVRLSHGSLSAEVVARLARLSDKGAGLQLLELVDTDLGGVEGIQAVVSRAGRVRELTLRGSIRDDIGALGPFFGEAVVDKTRSEVDFQTWATIEARHTAIREGKWYYEVTVDRLHRQEFLQVGWGDSGFHCKDAVDGVGDDAHSWAYDPTRMLVWHKRNTQPWGLPAKEGDTIGCFLDLDRRTMSFSLNGLVMGTAFSGIKFVGGLRPLITAGGKFRISVNFGERRFRHGPSTAHRPVSEWFTRERHAGMSDLTSALRDALATTRTLQRLSLAGNGLGPEIATSLADSVAACVTLEALDLSNNDLGSKGGLAIARMLGDEQCLLKELDLSENHLQSSSRDDACLFALAEAIKTNTSLTTLALARNGVQSIAGEALGDALGSNTTLQSLSLALNRNAGAAFVTALSASGNETVSHLCLTSTGLTESHGAMLASLVSLERLEVACNKLGVRGGESIFVALETSGLRELDMSSCELGAAIVTLGAVLDDVCPLTVLKVANNELGPMHGLQFVTALRAERGANLQELDVSDNNMGPESCTALLKLNRLRKLHIGGNMLGATAPGLTSFCETLARVDRLEELDLSNSDLRKAAAKPLAAALLKTKIRTISLLGNRLETEGLADLATGLAPSRTLKTLNISENNIGHEGMESIVLLLRGNTSLRKIIMMGNCISKEAQALVDQVLGCWWAQRAHVLSDLLLDKAPKSLVQRIFRSEKTKKLVWSGLAQSMAVHGLPSLLALLRWVEDSFPEAVSVYNCSRPLHFHECSFPVELPAHFQSTELVCFDRCSGAIHLGEGIMCGTLNISKCTGDVVLGQGLRVTEGLTILQCPRIETIPANLFVQHDLLLKNCPALRTLESGMTVTGDFGVAECVNVRSLPANLLVHGDIALVDLPNLEGVPAGVRQDASRDFVVSGCHQVTTLPEPLLRSPRRVLLHNTGIHRTEFVRLVSLSHPQLVWGIGDEELVENFPTMAEAIRFWLREAGVKVGEDGNLEARLESHIGGYFRVGVLSFLSKLRISKEYEHIEMRRGLARRVIEVLEAICETESAREELLVRIGDSVDTCGDKPIWALNQMKAVMLAAQARGDRAALLKLGLSVMRLGIVHEHVIKKIRSMAAEDVDDVCVYLRFEIELREVLDLPVTSESMLFPQFVKVSDRELEDAKSDALRVTPDSPDFQRWLASWPNWQRQLRFELASGLRFADLPLAKVTKRVSLSLTKFDGDDMVEPVALGKGGPWNFQELLDRWVETGMDFNNIEWAVEDFEAAIGRLLMPDEELAALAKGDPTPGTPQVKAEPEAEPVVVSEVDMSGDGEESVPESTPEPGPGALEESDTAEPETETALGAGIVQVDNDEDTPPILKALLEVGSDDHPPPTRRRSSVRSRLVARRLSALSAGGPAAASDEGVPASPGLRSSSDLAAGSPGRRLSSMRLSARIRAVVEDLNAEEVERLA